MPKKFIDQFALWLLIISFLNWSLFPFGIFNNENAYGAEFAVMIIPPPDNGKVSAAFIDAMAKAFKDTGRFDVVSRQEVERFAQSKTGGVAVKNLDAVFNDAVELLDKGQKLYNGLKVEESISVLQDAKAKFKEALPSIDNESDYSRFLGTYFYLGMAYRAKGVEQQAKQELREMVILDSKRKQRKFSSKYYPPQILAMYEQIRKEVLKAESAKLKIKSNPPQAKAYLDGEYTGDTPCDAAKLPVGEHFLVVEKDGYAKWSNSKFVVEGENSVEIDLKAGSKGQSLLELKTVSSSYDIPKNTAGILDEMGVSLGGDIFLIYEIQSKGSEVKLAGQIYDQRNQEVSRVEEVKIADVAKPEDGLAEFAMRLLPYLSPEGYVVASPQPGVPGKADDETPVASVNRPPEPDLTGKDMQGIPGQGEDQNWQTLPPKPPGQTKQWYEKGWVWGLIAGGILASLGGVLLFTDVAKSSATKSTLIIKK